MATIICHDVHGKPTPVAAEALQFSPAVYGIFIENELVLLQKQPKSGLWQPPGRPLTAQDVPTQALRHLFRELTGVIPVVGPFFYIEDQFFLDEEQCPWHLSLMYYLVERPPVAATALPAVATVQQPEWVPLAEISRAGMQFGYDAIQAGRQLLRL